MGQRYAAAASTLSMASTGAARHPRPAEVILELFGLPPIPFPAPPRPGTARPGPRFSFIATAEVLEARSEARIATPGGELRFYGLAFLALLTVPARLWCWCDHLGRRN